MVHLSILNKYFRKYKWLFLLGILFVLLTNYFRILYPQFTGYIVNTVVSSIKNDSSTSQPTSGYHEYNFVVRYFIHFFTVMTFSQKILYAGISLFVLAIISGFFMFLMRQTIIVMSRHIEFDQKNEIYNHYQNLDFTFYKKNTTGDLMNRISEDVSRVRMYTGPALMYFINLAAVIGFSIYFMLQSDVRLTLYALLPLPLLAITIYYVNAIINKKSEKIQQILSNITANAQESYSGIRVIKSFVQEADMISFFKKNNEQYRESALSLAKTDSIYFPTMGLMIGMSTLITILIGSLDVVHHVEGASVGKIAEFVLYIQMLTFPVSAIGWTASMTQRAAASQKRINEFLETPSSISDSPEAKDYSFKGNLKFKQLNFTYKNTGIHAVQDFSLEIKKGQKIAIIGKTGSGKTTIAQLLLRMYDADNGFLEFDDTDIQQIRLKSLRSQISYVPQDNFLFSDTIENNIKFGKPGASFIEVENAAKAAGIFNEIMKFENGFQTIVGERGITLSGGQKQRISIARALIKKPEIVIFDDCLSAVDARTEKQILENLNDALAEKTAIIITHRIFSLFRFDKIIVMDHGKIAESGTHQDLLLKNGLYAEMYKKQQMSENEGDET